MGRILGVFLLRDGLERFDVSLFVCLDVNKGELLVVPSRRHYSHEWPFVPQRRFL